MISHCLIHAGWNFYIFNAVTFPSQSCTFIPQRETIFVTGRIGACLDLSV